MKTKAYTLVEILIVLAIIGVLAAVLFPSLAGARKQAYDTAAESCAQQINLAQDLYRMDYGSYAGSLNDLDPDVVSGCDTSEIIITFDRATTDDYQVTLKHVRGTKTYVLGPSGLR